VVASAKAEPSSAKTGVVTPNGVAPSKDLNPPEQVKKTPAPAGAK
jgi:hypothetical protein